MVISMPREAKSAQPCIAVTKDCEPATGCLGGDITFSGWVVNCGDVELTNIQLHDDKGVITNTNCTSLPIGGTCTYSGIYTAPILLGSNTDTVTATGDAGLFGQIWDMAHATCMKTAIEPAIDVAIICVDASASGGNITYTVTVTNTTPLTCYDGTPWDDVLN
jgi:hypothetical protein